MSTAGVALGACSRGEPKPLLPSPFAEVGLPVAKRARLGLSVFPGGQEFVRGSQRLPLGLADDKGASIVGAPAKVWVGQGARATGPFDAAYRTYAHTLLDDDPHGFHVVPADIPFTGVVDVMVEAIGLYGFTTIEVRAKPFAPSAGQPAIAVATPTTGHPRGVKNICTRTPPCGMHTERLDLVLGDGKPVVFSLSSPKLCSSRTCGPVVDEILDVRRAHEDAAHFIHAEVYKGDSATVTSPTFDAWKVQSEPWTWIIDGEGIVRARFEGPVVASEIEPALRAVL